MRGRVNRSAVRFPGAIERDYAARLVRRWSVASAILRERLAWTERADESRADVDSADEHRVKVEVDAVYRAFELTVPVTERSLLPTAQAIDTWSTRGAVQAVESVVPVDIERDQRIGSRTRDDMRRLHLQWARENVDLIKTMDRDTFDQVAEHVVDHVVNGRTDLAQVLQDRFGVAESRARLIARDQTAKLNAAVTQARQTQLGIESYEWSSSGDERVRPLHRKLDGTVRRWDDPHPTEGHPGQAIACRCVAIPVIDLDSAIAAALEPEPDRPVAPPPPPPPAPPPPVVARPGPRVVGAPPAAPLDLSAISPISELFPGEDPADLPQQLERIYGRPVEVAEIVGWTGIDQTQLAGARVFVNRVGTGVEVTIETDAFELMRGYKRGPTGELVANHANLEIYDTGRGLGTGLFVRQVEEARRAGFTKITTYAAGNAREAATGGYNGYYTWPRLGYDGPIPRNLAGRLPPNLQGARTVQDLFATAEGQEWWRQAGEYTYLEFDLAEDSRSLQVLDAYLQAKGLARRADTDEPPPPPRPRNRRPADEIDLSPDEEAALTAAWERLRAERQR